MITLGPVQEFIAQARRTRDLWFGSHLLSKLSYETANSLHLDGATLIFPHLQKTEDKQQDQIKVANKIVALVNEGSERDLSIRARHAAKRSWYDYAKRAKEELSGCINEGTWERQIKDLLEFYAVWVTIDEKNSYTEALKQAEQLMSARKTLRDFKANEPGKLYGERKSDLDGGRESVLWPEKHPIYGRFGIKENEALDAISLVKRLAHHVEPLSEKFCSVCDIAFYPLKRQIATRAEWSQAAIQFQQQCIRLIEQETREKMSRVKPGLISWLFYESRLEENLLEYCSKIAPDRLQRLMEQITREQVLFYQQTKLRPTPYYALVFCDGDHMHKKLQKISNFKEHQALSQNLSTFADLAESIVEERMGALIYSGGDDVMALLPLDTCLQAIDELQSQFKALLNSEVGSEVTLSVGVAIAHMFEPLEQVRAQATAAEKLAKEQRDSLAIWYQKRSGGSQMKISIPFNIEPCERISQFQQLLRSGVLSQKFAFELRELYLQYKQLFKSDDWIDEAGQLELLSQEIVRLAIKKRHEDVDKQQAANQIAPINGALRSVAKRNKPLESLRIVAEMTIIASELLQEGGGFDGEMD